MSSTKDNLNSKQYFRVLDLLSEGEIEGFASPSKEGRTKDTVAYFNAAKKDIFLNNTAILQSDADSANPLESDFNYQDSRPSGIFGSVAGGLFPDEAGHFITFGPALDIKFGTADQKKTKGVQATGSPQTDLQNPIVEKGSPIVKEISDSSVEQIRITLDFPALQRVNSKGDFKGMSVKLRINVKYKGEADFTTVISDKVKGRSADLYQRSYLVDLEGPNANREDNFPCIVQVERVTSNTNNPKKSNKFSWSSYVLLKSRNLTYPNSAYTSLIIDSQQFQSIPQRTFRIRGIKVRIPAANGGLTPTVDNETGRIIYPDNYVFNGTMTTTKVWCSCPAMILLDLMTNKRYGFGTHIAPDQTTDAKLYENIDLFSYFNASKFANALVKISSDPDVFEPRFSCNVSIQNSNEAYKLINELAGVMRCMPIWSTGSISLAQDQPKDPSYLFSLSNVTEDGFIYSGSDLKTRSTVINVSYLNMDTRDIDYETVGDNTDEGSDDFKQADKDRQDKYGVVVKNIKAFATTSATQARRLAKAILFAEEFESETVTFTTSIDSGVVVRPNTIIEIQDPVRNGRRRAGRVKAATTTEITIDDINSVNLQTLTMGTNPKFSVILPDGTMEERDVVKINGAVFEVTPAFSQTPNVNTVWLYQDDNDNEAQLFRVISVTENDGMTYTVTALSYVSNKYNFIEEVDKKLEIRNISPFNKPVKPPKNLRAFERIVVINGKAVSKLIIDWQEPTDTITNPDTGETAEVAQGVSEYQVNYRLDDNNFTTVKVPSNDFEIFNTTAGIYEIQVFSYNVAGVISKTAAILNFEAVGKSEPPSDITGLSLEPVDDKNIRLRWDLHPDVDVIHGGQIYVKHNLKSDGTGTFSSSTNLIPALAGNSTFAVAPALEGEYILKARDDTGNFSTGETSVILDLPEEIKPLQVLTRREDLDSPAFQGVASANVEYSADLGAINLKSTGLFADIVDFAAVKSLVDLGAVASEGTYDFGGTAGGTALDLGDIYNIELKRHIVSEAFIPTNLFDFVVDVDLMTDFDGESVFNASADVLVRTSLNASTYAPTGTYSQTGTNEIVITITNHNFRANNFVTCDFTTGTATDGEFQIISITNANQFVIAVSDVVSTSGNVTCGADYTAFQPFANGRFKGESFKFRALLTSDDPNQDVKVTQLGYTASFPRRIEQSTQDIDAGSTGTKTVTFEDEFFTGTSVLGGVNSTLPSIGITAQNMLSGEFFEITSVTSSNFTVAFKTGSGAAATPSNRTGTSDTIKFGFTAVGFGKKG